MSQNVYVRSGMVSDLLALSTGTPTGDWKFKDAPQTTVQAVASAAATIVIEVSNDGVNAVATPLGTITLAAAGSDGFTTSAPWKFIRARVTANAGNVNVLTCV